MVNDLSGENLKNVRYSQAVSVCAELFLKCGIDNVKMTDIAEESGIGVATLYRYFGTKTGIAIEAATFLWHDIKRLFSGVFESELFKKQSGLKQLTDLMRMFVVLYTAHSDFMKFLSEFDLFLIRENVPKSELHEYEESIIDFFPMCEDAFKTGISDGTVRKNIDFKMFYLTYTHALTELSQKFIMGEILPSDDFSNGEKELNMLIETAEYFLKNDIK